MDKDMIRSLVASMGIASLFAGTALTAPVMAAESGWGGKTGAVSAQKKSASFEKMTSAVTADKKSEKAKKKLKDAAAKESKKPKEEPGKSGWGGSTK